MSKIVLKYTITLTYDPNDIDDMYGDYIISNEDIESIAEIHREELLDDPEEFLMRFKKIPSIEREEECDFEVVNYEE